MARALRSPRASRLALAALAIVASGCQLAPRREVEECHRVSQVLRSENASLKDQMLALRSQNQDYSERAVDDARRLAQLESANQQLESSVQAYQDERGRLEAAYKELRASLPGSLQPLGSNQLDGPPAADTAQRVATKPPRAKAARHQADPDIERTSMRPTPKTPAREHGAWMPSKVKPSPDRSGDDPSSISTGP